MKFTSDIDIDFGDRTKILSIIKHIPASIAKDSGLIKHNTGVYFTEVPVDPFTGQASLDYKSAENRGYVKLDFLNVGIYNQIKSESDLVEMMNADPDWPKLYDREFCSQLTHIGDHYETLIRMPEAVNSIPRMMMFLAIIRPAKRHLIGLPWQEVAKTIWTRSDDSGYAFKQSHSCAYAHLVVVHMNLLSRGI